MTGCNKKVDVENPENNNQVVEQEDTNSIDIVDNVEIKRLDNKTFEFVYRDEVFKAVFINDTWKIYDSYKITNSSDIKKICKALIDIHKIPSSDYKSYRTADDMVYEWKQHNLAYQILPEGNSFRESAKDVDLDPKDQGKSLVEMYEDRTGQKLDIGKLFK
jgi:hypothetical protein